MCELTGASWWIYVPLHELGHAFGCIFGGGTVTELQISPMYGAALLKEFFPFVTVGSEYAGQLTGFDTKGSDLIYLLTDFFPFLLTIFIGVPLLRSAAGSKPIWAAIKLGFGRPIAFAPFISFSGNIAEKYGGHVAYAEYDYRVEKTADGGVMTYLNLWVIYFLVEPRISP